MVAACGHDGREAVMTDLDSAAPRRFGRLRRLARGLVVLVVAAGLVAAGLVAGVQLADRRAAEVVGPASVVPSGANLVPASNGPGVPASTGPGALPAGPTAVLVGAGDISDCRSDKDEQTAALVAAIPGIVFTAGDNVYNTGTQAEFRRCYDPSWGRFRDRTYPAIGNHDAVTTGGEAYFDYFGAAAGPRYDGWYSYQAGTWHVIVLNSNCRSIGGCGEGSRELTWLKADLAAHPDLCTMAIWHHPRFSSGEHGDNRASDPFWRLLFNAHAELIINGHDHDYERFAPQTPGGLADPVEGIREIVAGTGGKSLRLFGRIDPNSEVRDAASYGVLRLDLAPGTYAWQFIATSDRAFGDSGTTACH
jgi:3',5'-cyclic AMP phosphodiesterase CpdA